jgi:hypothetical protein
VMEQGSKAIASQDQPAAAFAANPRAVGWERVPWGRGKALAPQAGLEPGKKGILRATSRARRDQNGSTRN